MHNQGDGPHQNNYAIHMYSYTYLYVNVAICRYGHMHVYIYSYMAIHARIYQPMKLYGCIWGKHHAIKDSMKPISLASCHEAYITSLFH